MPIDYVVTNGDPITIHADTTYSVDFTAHTTSTTDFETWINTEWLTGNWWYCRQNGLWGVDQTKFNNPFDDTYRTVTETDKDNEDFDTTEINKYLETLREEVVATED